MKELIITVLLFVGQNPAPPERIQCAIERAEAKLNAVKLKTHFRRVRRYKDPYPKYNTYAESYARYGALNRFARKHGHRRGIVLGITDSIQCEEYKCAMGLARRKCAENNFALVSFGRLEYEDPEERMCNALSTVIVHEILHAQSADHQPLNSPNPPTIMNRDAGKMAILGFDLPIGIGTQSKVRECRCKLQCDSVTNHCYENCTNPFSR